MSILTVKNLSHGFGDRAIFKDVSFRLLKGEHIGLIGANGEGKSTFMSVITHTLEPDEGSIEWSKNTRVGYIDQKTILERDKTIQEILKTAFQYLFDLEAKTFKYYEDMASADEETLAKLMEEVGTIQDILNHNDFYNIDSKINEVSKGLGLLDFLDRPASDLSGGQRTKVLLAKLLLEKPDILLLDEPTNHLDEVHINWLKRYLLEYENAFVLISHDLEFLNEVINLVYHMENQELNRYVGNYDDFLKVYEMKKAQLEAAYKRQQQEINKLEDFVARNKARVSTRNMAMSRQKKLDKMEKIELKRENPKPEFNFLYSKTPSKQIFTAEDIVIGYNEPLCKPFNFILERNEKIAIIGSNGIGKTTLLKSLIGQLKVLNGKVEIGPKLDIGYFEQEVLDENNNTCIEEIWNTFPSMSQFEVRAALAKCGLTTKHIESKVKVLSGGEKAKVRLCKLINIPSNVLVLDEPTNHLDQDAKNELKRALKEYKGSVLLISHEPSFYTDIATKIINLEEWTTKLF